MKSFILIRSFMQHLPRYNQVSREIFIGSISHSVNDNMSTEALEYASDIDYIFENIVGGGGLWQWYIVVVMYPIVFASGFPLILHMFTAFAPRHRCFVPGCDFENDDVKNASLNDIDASFLNFALPREYSSTEIFTTAEHDPCHMYQHDGSGTCSATAFDNQTIVSCDSWVYDKTLFPETLTTKLDLVSIEIHGTFVQFYPILNFRFVMMNQNVDF